MGLRPRTRRAKALKKLRCPKCRRAIDRQRKRCTTCHAVQTHA